MKLARDLRGVSRLAINGVTGIADVVEAMHAAIGHPPALVGRSAPARTTGLTGFVYRSVRGVTRLLGSGVDRSLAALEPMIDSASASPRRDALVAAINGVLGDHLEAAGNPLAIRMALRHRGEAVEPAQLASTLPAAGGKLLVLVHGLCMNDRQWNYAGHDHGEALARDLGYTPVHLHYNSGRAIASNGRDFARLLEQLIESWPVAVDELVLLCHSMGGLVARSALASAASESQGWARLPLRIVFLGTPHHGAPLERAGNWVDQLIGISPYSAPFVALGQLRSAGIQDLRHGDATPLPEHVRAYAVAASTHADGNRGDGLVPVASALGEHADQAQDLCLPKRRKWLGKGITHMQLLGDARVYRRLAHWLSDK